MMWDASKKAWVPAKGKHAAHAAARVPDPAAPVNRDAEGYQTSVLPTLRSEDELAAYQKDLVAKAKVQRYLSSMAQDTCTSFLGVLSQLLFKGGGCRKHCTCLLDGTGEDLHKRYLM